MNYQELSKEVSEKYGGDWWELYRNWHRNNPQASEHDMYKMQKSIIEAKSSNELTTLRQRLADAEEALESERAAHIETRESLRSREAILKEHLENERQAHEATRQDRDKLDDANIAMSFQMLEKVTKIAELTATCDRYREALEKIANMDIKYGWSIKYDLQNIAKEALGADQNLAINDQNVAMDSMAKDDHENTLLIKTSIKENPWVNELDSADTREEG